MSKEPRLTDLQRICNLNVMQAMAVKQYFERWVAAAIPPSPPARSAESFGLEPEMQPVVDELRRRMAVPQTGGFTENEIKDVLTSLYQDGHVDLVLADRVAALMNQSAVPGAPTPARTTLICAAHMLDACAENMEKLCVGYGAEQMRGIAERLREGTPTLEQAILALPPSSPAVDVLADAAMKGDQQDATDYGFVNHPSRTVVLRQASPLIADDFNTGGTCPCGALIKFATGIGPFCSRTGIDGPCTHPLRRLIEQWRADSCRDIDDDSHDTGYNMAKRETADELEAALPPSSPVADTKALMHAITIACGVGGVTPDQQRASWREVARIALELAGITPVADKCVIGEYCRLHQFVHGGEAEELRERFEKLANDDRRNCKRSAVRRILDDVDARDSCALVESAPSAPAAANEPNA